MAHCPIIDGASSASYTTVGGTDASGDMFNDPSVTDLGQPSSGTFTFYAT